MTTGAARGQGAAHTRAFVREGARVLLADVLDAEGLALAEELGDNAMFVHLDVAYERSWTPAVATLVERFGTRSVLVNNTGIVRRHHCLTRRTSSGSGC